MNAGSRTGTRTPDAQVETQPSSSGIKGDRGLVAGRIGNIVLSSISGGKGNASKK
jgi:hypothetical protein